MSRKIGRAEKPPLVKGGERGRPRSPPSGWEDAQGKGASSSAGSPPAPPSPKRAPPAESLTEASADSTPMTTAASSAKSPPAGEEEGGARRVRSCCCPCCSPCPPRSRLPFPSDESLAAAADRKAEAAERGVRGEEEGERGVAGSESVVAAPLRAKDDANAAANSARLPPRIALPPRPMPPLPPSPPPSPLGVAAAEEECLLLSLPPGTCSWL